MKKILILLLAVTILSITIFSNFAMAEFKNIKLQGEKSCIDACGKKPKKDADAEVHIQYQLCIADCNPKIDYLHQSVDDLQTQIDDIELTPGPAGTPIMTGKGGFDVGPYFSTLHYYNGFGPTLGGQSESEVQMPLPRDCTVKSFTLKICENDLDGPITFTVRKNGADTLIKFTISSGQTGTFFDTSSVFFSTGDLYSMEVDFSAATFGETEYSYLFEY